MENKKTKEQRQAAYDSLPPAIRESLTPEEKQTFLNAEVWPEELFEKLDEFIINE